MSYQDRVLAHLRGLSRLQPTPLLSNALPYIAVPRQSAGLCRTAPTVWPLQGIWAGSFEYPADWRKDARQEKAQHRVLSGGDDAVDQATREQPVSGLHVMRVRDCERQGGCATQCKCGQRWSASWVCRQGQHQFAGRSHLSRTRRAILCSHHHRRESGRALVLLCTRC